MTIYETDTDLYRFYTGSAWEVVLSPGAWISYTPTYTNFTLGNGVVTARYRRTGRLVNAIVEIQLGSTSSVSGDFSIAMPLAIRARTYTVPIPVGEVIFQDDSTGNVYFGVANILGSTSTVSLRPINVTDALSYARTELTSSTVPMTWAASDRIALNAFYETSAT
jgi:hypothetical protein